MKLFSYKWDVQKNSQLISITDELSQGVFVHSELKYIFMTQKLLNYSCYFHVGAFQIFVTRSIFDCIFYIYI